MFGPILHSCLGKIWFICSRRLVVLGAVVSIRRVVRASRIGVTCAVGLPAKSKHNMVSITLPKVFTWERNDAYLVSLLSEGMVAMSLADVLLWGLD